jgi:hypothetical protein
LNDPLFREFLQKRTKDNLRDKYKSIKIKTKKEEGKDDLEKNATDKLL